MNKEWYNIDVKREVLKDVQKFFLDSAVSSKVIEVLKNVSVRDMMDISFINKLEEVKDSDTFTKYVSDRYMYYRSAKYGQEGFWESAATERNIGYYGSWYEYITRSGCYWHG